MAWICLTCSNVAGIRDSTYRINILTGRESGVACRRTAAAVLLNVGQEFEAAWLASMCSRHQLGWLPFQPFAGEREQQPEGMGVRLAGVGTENPFLPACTPGERRLLVVRSVSWCASGDECLGCGGNISQQLRC